MSLWVRDIPVDVRPVARQAPIRRRPHPQHLARIAEVAECDRSGIERLGRLSEEAFLAAGAALYAGEGGKRDRKVVFANTGAAIVAFFCAWLGHFFDVDETRLRARVYLHEGLDLDAAVAFWSEVTGITSRQFLRPYRAVADSSIRTTKHEYGCAYVSSNCARTHRQIMGLVRALLASVAIPG